MWTRTAFLFAALTGLLIAGCSWTDSDSNPVPTAKLRIVHASPDAPAVDIQVDGAVVLSNVAYQDASAYLDVPPRAALKVLAAGTDTAVIEVADLGLTAQQRYSVIAAGPLAQIRPLVLSDDRTAPMAGNARIRVVHAAPAAPAVDIYVTAPAADLATASPAVAAAAFEDASDYLTLPAGDYRVRITAAGDAQVLFDSGTITFAEGSILDVVATESTGFVAPVDLLALTGQAAEPLLRLTDNRALLRVLHLSPDAPNVDVYADGMRVLVDVPFKAVSDYLLLPSGSHEFAITAHASTGSVASLTADLARGAAYSVAALGQLSGLELQAFQDDLSAPADGQAHVRVLHASPDAPNVDVLVDGSVVLADVPFKVVSDYLGVAAGAHSLQVNLAGTSTTVLSASPDLPEGAIYTAAAVGLAGDSSLALILPRDR